MEHHVFKNARLISIKKNVYSPGDENAENSVVEKLDKTLDNESKQNLEGNIDMLEVVSALKKTQKTNKSPGPDGIPVVFYKLYWPTIGEDLLDVFRTGLDDGRLPHSQYVSDIGLLYKKGPGEDIRNWRLIPLLSTDYKLLSKVLAERIKSVYIKSYIKIKEEW